MELDWGDGDYGTTAKQLEPATLRALDSAKLSRGESVLDLGCGNGNVTLEAARRGAQVTAVDPSARLLQAAQRRAEAQGLNARFLQGDGARVEAPDASFDAVVAVFSVIFAPDAEACAKEMLRVVKPGGRVVVTSWLQEGAVNDIAEVIIPPDAPRPASPWPFTDKIRELFAPYAVDVSIEEDALPMRSSSAKAWLDDLEDNHPVWRMMKNVRAAEWDALQARSLEILERANEEPDAFCCTSKYLITRIDRH